MSTCHPYIDLHHPNHRIMTRAEELEAFQAYKAGEKKAMDRIIMANMKFAAAVARRYEKSGLPIEDLMAAAVMGLLKAAPRFNPANGNKFISYAVWWVRQQVLEAIAAQSRPITLGASILDFATRMAKVRVRLEQRKGYAVGPEEIKEAISKDERALFLEQFDRTATLEYLNEPVRLDHMLEEHGRELADPAAGPDVYMGGMNGRHLEFLMGALNPREKMATRLYYGLDTGVPSTLEDVAIHMGLTRERVRQLKDKALKKMLHRASMGETAREVAKKV